MAFLLAIEGIDGAGKGTLAQALKNYGCGKGLNSAVLSFPRYSETAFAQLIAQYLNGDLGALDTVPAKFVALLYAGDRFESQHHLKRLCDEHELVILDRYVASNLAYAAAKVPTDQQSDLIDWILTLELKQFELPSADLTCLVTTAAAQADAMVGRKEKRDYTEAARDLHEQDRPYMEQVRTVYHRLCRDNIGSTWFTLNPTTQSGALRPPQDLAEEVWRVLAKHAPSVFAQ